MSNIFKLNATPLAACFLSCLGLAFGGPARASDTTPDYGDRLTGGWGGARAAMAEKGYDWDIVYKLDALTKLNGHSRNGNLFWLDNLDVSLSVDGEKFGWKGFSALLYVLSNRGEKPAEESGRLPHGLDNIETPPGANTTKIYEAWLQQAFADGRLSVLAGLYDLNSEFYRTESSALFIQPTYGIGAEFAGTGRNGPSIFPTTSMALRVSYLPTPKTYLLAAVMDGVPGDPDNPHGTHIKFDKGDGTLQAAELGYHLGSDKRPEGKLALGAWRYTATFDDLLDVDAAGNPVKRHSYGAYVVGERVLWRRGDKDLQGFLRAGRNDGNTAQFVWAWSTGLVWRGLIPGRPDDLLGIGFSEEENAWKYRAASGNGERYERAAEFTYRRQVTPWLAVQPFAQYLINHGSIPAEDRTWWTGIRLELVL